MFRHIILFRLQNPTEEARQALKDKLLTLRGNVPQVRELEAGTDVLQGQRSYDVALIIGLDKKEDLPAYKNHPFHLAVSEYVQSVIQTSVSCDFEVEK